MFITKPRNYQNTLANLLQEVTFILNSLPNASTSLSPHEFMYGTPLGIQLDKWLPFHDSGDYVEAQEYAERTAKQNAQLWSKVHTKFADSQSKMKKKYDCKSKASTIEVDDWVLVDEKPGGNSISPLFGGPWKNIGANIHVSYKEH